jgi:hypothetical protein
MFALVLSFVSRQRKERLSLINLYMFLVSVASNSDRSFSFARPKENEPKEKGARENGPPSADRHVPTKEAISI